MARAYSIYIIMRNGAPLAAFTVMHEAESWIARNHADLVAHGARFYVCRDGGHGTPQLSARRFGGDPDAQA